MAVAPSCNSLVVWHHGLGRSLDWPEEGRNVGNDANAESKDGRYFWSQAQPEERGQHFFSSAAIRQVVREDSATFTMGGNHKARLLDVLVQCSTRHFILGDPHQQ